MVNVCLRFNLTFVDFACVKESQKIGVGKHLFYPYLEPNPALFYKKEEELRSTKRVPNDNTIYPPNSECYLGSRHEKG